MMRWTVLRWVQIAIDLAVLSIALWLACILRFEGMIPPQVFKRALFLWPYVVGAQYVLLISMGVPRFVWRYVGLREVVRIFLCLLTAAAVLTVARFIAGRLGSSAGAAQYAYLPLGVVGIDFALSFLGISGVRILRRMTTERTEANRTRPDGDATPTLLIGAGRAGLMVAKEIANRPELNIVPVGFIDDDPVKQGNMIHGIQVLGRVGDVEALAHERGVKQAIITIANAPGAEVRKISEACRRAGLRVKIIPGLYQLVGGELNLTRLRDVAIEDLLRREPVELDIASLRAELKGRAILVTGAGGSIGSEICRQVARFEPRQLIAVERSENALFEIERELRRLFPNLDCRACLADICDQARMERLFVELCPEVVYHAAAHKHVPMMESNPGEAIKNNVVGTRLLSQAAHRHGVRSFVMISTDKAVNPSSVMGASKRVAEIYVQALARVSKTRFVTVRFGNVLGSNGSVVPIFQEQIARGGPVTVTDPDMKRYFMTIPEACQLVLQAGSMGAGGEIFILDMGEPVRIVDLARDLIRLSGYDEGEIEVVFTGKRPGEKLYEELSVADENAERTRHPKIFIGRTTAAELSVADRMVDRLQETAADPNRTRRALELELDGLVTRESPADSTTGIVIGALAPSE